MDRKLKVILSGGGTGGHIYPAVAVAEALKRRLGDGVEILFVGAEGKMEMEKIPELGYRIEGLPVAGLQRRLTPKNLAVPFKVVRSVLRARRIVKKFGADVAVGFGGYASAPVPWSAQRMGIPTLIQEQNSYAGMTNKMLSSRVRRICQWLTKGWNAFSPKEEDRPDGEVRSGGVFGRGSGSARGGASAFRFGRGQAGDAGRRRQPRYPDAERNDRKPTWIGSLPKGRYR